MSSLYRSARNHHSFLSILLVFHSISIVIKGRNSKLRDIRDKVVNLG
jgi:hypothetical protein